MYSFCTERAGRFVESKSTRTESEVVGDCFDLYRSRCTELNVCDQPYLIFSVMRQGFLLMLLGKLSPRKDQRVKFTNVWRSENVTPVASCNTSGAFTTLPPFFSFSRGFVSRQYRSRNYPHDLKSQLPIRVISMTMYFSDGFNIFRGTGFYSDLEWAFLWFVPNVFKILQTEGHWNVMPASLHDSCPTASWQNYVQTIQDMRTIIKRQ
jgi:hypothetical protein